MVIVHSIRFQAGPTPGSPGRELDLHALDVKQHLDIRYRETKVDWETQVVSDQFKATDIPAKKCDLVDFTTGEQDPIAQRYFDEWKWYTTICPDFSNHPNKSWVFTGDTASMKSQRGEFVVERCTKPFMHNGVEH